MVIESSAGVARVFPGKIEYNDGMRALLSRLVPSVWTTRALVFGAACLLQGVFWWQVWRDGVLPLWLLLAAALVAVLAAWVAGLVVSVWREQAALKLRLGQAEDQLQTWKSYWGQLQQVDLRLQDATSEEQVMEIALGYIASLSAARGVSFVPLDDWGQPLPAFTFGKLPPAVLRAWNEHLATSHVREVCRDCQALEAETGEPCPLNGGPFADSMGVSCFPVQRGGRMLGMVNLYRTGQGALSDELSGYLRGLMVEAALVVESIRVRNREINTLRQVQAIRPTRSDLQQLLGMLLEGMQQALGTEAVQLQARGWEDTHQPPVLLELGDAALFAGTEAARARDWLLANPGLYAPAPSGGGTIAGVTLARQGGEPQGTLLLAARAPFVLDERATGILKSVADQAALLIENERDILSLEYRTVIQERARLAREIHDGLAQTLAFLKLQAAQMQVYLAQGNLSRLSQVLKQNYDELAQAYQETRMAIDNLRLSPQHGLTTWLDDLLDAFEAGSGLAVERAYQPVRGEISPEVQAQMVRIVQEALNNIRKHARASRVSVKLHEWNGDLVLEVRDDGAGFSMEDVPGTSKYGLRGMQERAELIGADFQVISKEQQGTTVRLSLPLRSREMW